MALEVVRTDRGTFAPGHTGNPEGGRAHAARRKINLAAERSIEQGECAQDIAQKLVEGMLDPDGLPVAARLAYERLWPVTSKHELSGPGGGAIEIASADQWSRFADAFGAELPEDSTGLIEVDASSPDRGES